MNLDEVSELVLEFFAAESSAFQTKVSRQLQQYQHGTRTHFSIPYRLTGTPFQLAVWQAIAAIPYGETRSYAAIAKAIGNPRAVRAVGQACNRNPLPLIVPCHRVVASHGLGGFGFGLKLKQALLEHERLVSANHHNSTLSH